MLKVFTTSFTAALLLAYPLAAQDESSVIQESREGDIPQLLDSVPTGSSDVAGVLPQTSTPAPEFIADNFKISGEEINYTLAPGDVITLRVFQEADMTTQQRISQDGSVFLPLIGKIKLAEMSIGEASRKITEILQKDYFVNPQVNLSIDRYAPRRFTILGQASRPGTYQIPAEEVVSLPMAIAIAGGNTRIGDLKRVVVSRKEGDEIKTYRLDVRNAESREFIVQPGDIITIPERLF